MTASRDPADPPAPSGAESHATPIYEAVAAAVRRPPTDIEHRSGTATGIPPE
ncbi:hypothetical protein ACFXPA_48585 [Amycolatopsis sp. NPDC059090]|uniref:hypothetical protein n=1 Tax=Amycolatopsis sp. NPDC059090 TaxID=3346723 RepID=UPI003671B643